MSASPPNDQTPGVYVNEINAFPRSIVEVPSAIPAFIGYTPKAEYKGKSYLNKPVKITSFNDFKAFFMLPDPPAPADPAAQYSPQFYTSKLDKAPEQGDSYKINGELYAIEPDPGTIYYLYNMIRQYFQNGGGEAYVVSVGTYGKPTGSPIKPGDRIVNFNVRLNELMHGLSLIKQIPEITLYVVPEATLLNTDDNSQLMQAMLTQGAEMNAFSILDIIGGRAPDPVLYMQDIAEFRNSTGNHNLSFGAAYYPFVITTTTSADELSYLNLNDGNLNTLKSLISPENAPNKAAEELFSQIRHSVPKVTAAQINNILLNVSQPYRLIMGVIRDKVNTLPPSATMVGIYHQIDNSEGFWLAPANVTPIGVTKVTLSIDNKMQEGLNVDAVSGKSINAIRFFNGQGLLVWGARTLDGNSQDWRYINVRRTMIVIEQSIKVALEAFSFSKNDSNTWTSVKAMIENFLNNLWQQGALQGSSPDQAFSVSVGIGSTMTAQDILEGRMIVAVKLALIRPAEFIILQLEQEMSETE